MSSADNSYNHTALGETFKAAKPIWADAIYVQAGQNKRSHNILIAESVRSSFNSD